MDKIRKYSCSNLLLEYKSEDKLELDEFIKNSDKIVINFCHEFKTPINVIFGASQLMEVYVKNNSFEMHRDRVVEAINSIKQNSFRLIKVINNITDLASIEAGQFNLYYSTEDVVSFVENIVEKVEKFARNRDLRVIFDTNIKEKIMDFDLESIERVILNLLSNAIKFSKEKGSILVKVNDMDDKVEVEIVDNGIGIDKQYMSNVFDRCCKMEEYLSKGAEGLGMGLCLSKAIVELHGGDMRAYSILNEGSVFKFRIPPLNKQEHAIKNDIYNRYNMNEMIDIEFSDIE
jgi:signal transduction histidine kinase